MTKKWIYDEDDEPRLFYGDEDFNGSAYPCDDPFFMKIIANKLNELEKENEELKASLYAEKTNTAEVINEYAKQFKRHSSQFSFMIDLAEDLGIDVSKLEALDD